MSASVDLETWDTHLQPLIKLMHVCEYANFRYDQPNATFVDTAGRSISFSYLRSHSKASIINMLLAQKDAAIELETDKGRHYFTLQQHKPSGCWVLSETKIDVRGYIGIFTDSVVVDKVEEIVEFVENIKDED